MVGDKTLCLIFLPEIRLWYHWSKMTQKRVSKFSRPPRFCFISWHCFINFVRPCLSNHFFCNSSQSPANSNFSLLILLYLQSLAETCNENITCALYTKVLSLTVFCKQFFMFDLQVKNRRQKAFNFGWWCFSDRTFSLRINIDIFRNLNH